MKVLLVVDDLGRSGGPSASIGLANALSSDHRVYLCNARPWECHPDPCFVNGEVVFLEGTLGPAPWPIALDPPGAESLSGQSRRSDLLRELIRIHQIDVIHSRSPAADRLVLDIKEGLDIPWVAQLDGSPVIETIADPSILSRVLRLASCVLHGQETDASELRRLAHPSGPRLIGLPGTSDIEPIASICSRAYAEILEVRSLQAGDATLPMPCEATSWSTRQSA